MELVASSVFVLFATDSAFAVVLVNFARSAPMILVGAFVGALAERVDRKKLLIVGAAVLSVSTLVLGVLAAHDEIKLWHLLVGGFVNGVVFSSEFPVRRSLLGEYAGMDRIGAGMGLDSFTRNATRVIGPALGGVFLQFVGLDGAFFTAAAVYVVTIALMWHLSPRPTPAATAGPNMLTAVVDGFRYARRDRLIFWFLTVTVIMNLFAFPYQATVPVIAREVLRLEPFPISLLVAAEGAGAMLGSLAIALWDRPRRYVAIYTGGAALFMIAILGFASSPWYGLSLAIVFVGGLGIAGFTTLQGTLPFLLAPPEIRGRIMGVLSVCIGVGPIGYLHLGLLTELWGAPVATMVIAVEALIALALATFFLMHPALRIRAGTGDSPPPSNRHP